MKIQLKCLAIASLIFSVVTTANARPMLLPDAAVTTGQTGSFSVTADNQITLTGNPVSLTTSLPASGDVASGSARFMGGSLQYADGATTVDGRIAKVTYGSQVTSGQVTYLIKGLVFGTLTQGGSSVDVNGDFTVTTVPAPVDTPLEQTQVDASHLLLTLRSNINNPAVQ